jgi:hypothetical protein
VVNELSKGCAAEILPIRPTIREMKMPRLIDLIRGGNRMTGTKRQIHKVKIFSVHPFCVIDGPPIIAGKSGDKVERIIDRADSKFNDFVPSITIHRSAP